MEHKVRKMRMVERWICEKCGNRFKTKKGAERHAHVQNWIEKHKLRG